MRTATFISPGRRAAVALVLAVVAGFGGGCGAGGKPTGSVEGRVLYKGQPVTEGEVQLELKERGLGTTAPLDASGGFTVASLETGTYKVAIGPPQAGEAAGKRPAKVPVPLPAKAREFGTSGLTVTVKEGSNPVTLELKD